LSKEEKLQPAPLKKGQKASSAQIESGEVKSEKIRILVTEKIVTELEREGGMKKAEVEGEMKISIFDPTVSKCQVVTNGKVQLREEEGWKCRLHPKISKNLWGNSAIIALSDPTTPFPVGSDKAPTVLKWRKTSNITIPLKFTFNPWSESGRTALTIEYELTEGFHLSNIMVRIPCPCNEQPEVQNVEGEWKFDMKKKECVWKIAEISGDNATGSFEFSVPELPDESFFPVTVDFNSNDLISGIGIERVELLGDKEGGEAKFELESNLTVEKYQIIE